MRRSRAHESTGDVALRRRCIARASHRLVARCVFDAVAGCDLWTQTSAWRDVRYLGSGARLRRQRRRRWCAGMHLLDAAERARLARAHRAARCCATAVRASGRANWPAWLPPAVRMCGSNGHRAGSCTGVTERPAFSRALAARSTIARLDDCTRGSGRADLRRRAARKRRRPVSRHRRERLRFAEAASPHRGYALARTRARLRGARHGSVRRACAPLRSTSILGVDGRSRRGALRGSLHRRRCPDAARRSAARAGLAPAHATH